MPSEVYTFENEAIKEFVDKCLISGKIGAATKKMQEEIQIHLKNNSPSMARLTLLDHSALLTDIQILNQPIFSELKSLESDLEKISRECALKFEREFPELAISEGIDFCEGTIHPNYFVDRSFLEVIVNLRNMSCYIRTRGGKDHRVGIEPQTVVDAIKFHLNRIHNRDISEDDLLNRIEKTYFEMTSLESYSGEGLNLKDFVKSYQKNYKAALDEAIFDVSRAHKLFQKMKLDYVRDHEQGYQLYGFEENGYFGFIRIESK